MMSEQYIWFVWSSAFLVPWGLLFALAPDHRRIILQASLATMPFGLTEPLFVPEYWSPPSLFDLALRTGFDIESLIFCFAIGGIGVVLYNAVTGAESRPVSNAYRRAPLHRHHKLAIATPFLVFPVLYFLPWNPIYPSIVAMTAGSIATLLCRPDLWSKTWVGGMFFTGFYWLYLAGLTLLSPGYVERVWNLAVLSGIMILGSPLEELLFAFTFGMYWAGVYEHLTWQTPAPA
jgi:hypothetical protein